MKVFAVSKRQMIVVSALAFLVVVAGSVSAFAVSASQVARALNNISVTAQCCVPIGPTVKVSEPTSVTPVIVTFNTDYIVDGTAEFGLSVNGGPCLLYGSAVAPSLTFGPGSNSPFKQQHL